MIGMVFGATKFTEATRYQLLSTVMFPDFIYSCIRSYEINKTNKLAKKINSTESYTRIMDFKILPEPRYIRKIFQKNYQALFPLD